MVSSTHHMLYTLMGKNVPARWVGVYFIISSTKHVTKSPTEVKLSECRMGGNLGLMYLMEEQGYNVKPLIFYQDKKSVILLWRKTGQPHKGPNIGLDIFSLKIGYLQMKLN